MSKEYTTRSRQSRQYKGKVPLKIDLLLFSLFKMLFAFMYFFIIYVLFIGFVRNNPNYSLASEMVYIFIVMIVSDVLGRITASLLDTYFINHWGYLRNYRRHRALLLSVIEYVIYTILRVIFLVFNFTFALTNFLMNNYGMTYLFAFFIAWVLSGMIARVTAWVITHFLI